MVKKDKLWRNRKPSFVSPDFKKKIETIQGKLLINGKKKSFPDITDMIIKTPEFNQVEKRILEELKSMDQMDINIKFDSKRLFK